MKNLPKAVTFPQFPSITAYDDDGEEEVNVFIGDIAEKYLQKFSSTSCANKTFGLRDKDGKFYFGNKESNPKVNKSLKRKHILKPIWDENDLHTGNGIPPSVPTIILPFDPIALVERLDIRLASKSAGNTRVRKEFVSVCDELLRQNWIDNHTYKIIILQ